MKAVSLQIQSVITFHESHDVKMNITKYYPLNVFGNHMQENIY